MVEIMKSYVTSALREKLLAHDVELPYPTQQIILHNQLDT